MTFHKLLFKKKKKDQPTVTFYQLTFVIKILQEATHAEQDRLFS